MYSIYWFTSSRAFFPSAGKINRLKQKRKNLGAYVRLKPQKACGKRTKKSFNVESNHFYLEFKSLAPPFKNPKPLPICLPSIVLDQTVGGGWIQMFARKSMCSFLYSIPSAAFVRLKALYKLLSAITIGMSPEADKINSVLISFLKTRLPYIWSK